MAFGAPPDVVAAEVEREREAATFEVYAENWTTVEVFRALGTQWRIAAGFSSAVYTGLDYGSIPAVLDLLCVSDRERGEVFAGLRLMESAALRVWNKGDDG